MSNKKDNSSTGSGGLRRSGAKHGRGGSKNPSKLDTGAAAASEAKSKIDNVMSPSMSGPSAAELAALDTSGTPATDRPREKTWDAASPTLAHVGAAASSDQAMKAHLEKAPADKK